MLPTVPSTTCTPEMHLSAKRASPPTLSPIKADQAQRDRDFLQSLIKRWQLKQACAERNLTVAGGIHRRTVWVRSSPVIKAAYSSLPITAPEASACFFALVLPKSKWERFEGRSEGPMRSLRKELSEKLDRAVGHVEFWITLTYVRMEVTGGIRRPLSLGGCLWLRPSHKERAIDVLRSMSHGACSSRPLLSVDRPGSRYELVSMLTKHVEKAWALEERWAYATTSNLKRSARRIYEDPSCADEVARGLLSPGAGSVQSPSPKWMS